MLAIAQAERSPAAPNVPTTIEAGLPQMQASGWNAMFAPKGTPREIIDKLAAAASRAADDPVTRKRLEDIGGVVPPPDKRGPDALRNFVAAEVAKWTPVLKAASASGK
jgi:tripartite-type tricarboxylate transporter receptor subunit TctC